jgi:uncharacterized paraquat-inducible protein A
MAVCRYHPDRPGIGVCMRCRAVICAACSTRVDGVNHCHACLRSLARRDESARSTNVGVTLAALALLGFGWLVLFGIGLLFEGQLSP